MRKTEFLFVKFYRIWGVEVNAILRHKLANLRQELVKIGLILVVFIFRRIFFGRRLG